MNILSCSIPKARVLKDKQVLVIDNDCDTLSFYTVLLEDYGANVVAAISIKEALEVFDWLLPDLLICEMEFRGERIDTLTAKLSEVQKKAGNHISAIAITTWVTDSLAHTLDVGFAGYLLKPIDLDIFMSMIENLLASSRSYSSYVLQV